MITIMTIIATFTAPEEIGTNPASLLWLLPLSMAIAVVYKATKVHTLKAGSFIKECLFLFGSIVVFVILAAVILLIIAKFVT